MHRFLQVISAFFVFEFVVLQVGESADFQKSYTLGPGSRIKIENVSGDIEVSGYTGSTIQVKGITKGRDKDQVDVEETSDAGSLSLKARYPHNGNCDASVRFEVQVPRSTAYKFENLSTASGDIKVKDVTGDLDAHSASGDLHIETVTGGVRAQTASGDVAVKEVRGSVIAESASGDVSVEITKLEGNDHRMKVASASGDVRVKLPANPDVEVEMSTVSGSVETEFPIQVQTSGHGPGQSAHGRLGDGTYSLQLTTVSGDVHLGQR